MSDEITTLIEPQIPAPRRYARALLRDRDAADDLVQDTLERAISRWSLRRRDGDLKSWLFTIERNLFLAGLRQTRRRGVNVGAERLEKGERDAREACSGRAPGSTDVTRLGDATTVAVSARATCATAPCPAMVTCTANRLDKITRPPRVTRPPAILIDIQYNECRYSGAMTDVNQQSSPRPSFRSSLARAAAAVALVSAFAGGSNAHAQDASFGCKVLLCAAATAPGWAGIPYCVPVMQQLIRQVGRGGAWPVCLEGQVASPSSAPSAAGAPEAAPSLDVTAGRN